jgi:cytochrome c
MARVSLAWFVLTLACSQSHSTTPPMASPFRKVTLDDEPGEPIALAVLPDRRVLHTTRTGTVWLHEPSGGKKVALELPVDRHDEEGLQGIAIGPEFQQDGWVYLYYSPPGATPVDDAGTPEVDEGAPPVEGGTDSRAAFAGSMRLSRLRFEQDHLDPASEQVILEVPADRGICCHVGGEIGFDPAGNLYLSTGDDTNPFSSGGYAPLDERPERHPAYDAQRTAANTNDLRGKLLRIHVEPDGSYTIPPNNLFAPGTDLTRPEIYVMGLRNPFRFAIDRVTGAVYLADYAPDAPVGNPLRGPAGTGKWMLIDNAGNYGWPYCATPDLPYVDYDFATGRSGEVFDCSVPVNESPNNTGLRELPPVLHPEVYYSYARSTLFPELGAGGISPMAGPAYQYRADAPSAVQWPEDYAGAPLFYEWTRDFVSAFHLREADARGVARIELLSPDIPVDNPIDMEFGPDGALYVLEYGNGYFTANPEAQLSRIEYSPPPEP